MLPDATKQEHVNTLYILNEEAKILKKATLSLHEEGSPLEEGEKVSLSRAYIDVLRKFISMNVSIDSLTPEDAQSTLNAYSEDLIMVHDDCISFIYALEYALGDDVSKIQNSFFEDFLFPVCDLDSATTLSAAADSSYEMDADIQMPMESILFNYATWIEEGHIEGEESTYAEENLKLYARTMKDASLTKELEKETPDYSYIAEFFSILAKEESLKYINFLDFSMLSCADSATPSKTNNDNIQTDASKSTCVEIDIETNINTDYPKPS